MIIIQNFDDNEGFNWCLVRYLHLGDHNPRRITKRGTLSGEELDFQNLQFPVKIKEFQKFEKKNSIGISVFGYENKVKYPFYVSKSILKNMLIHY